MEPAAVRPSLSYGSPEAVLISREEAANQVPSPAYIEAQREAVAFLKTVEEWPDSTVVMRRDSIAFHLASLSANHSPEATIVRVAIERLGDSLTEAQRGDVAHRVGNAALRMLAEREVERCEPCEEALQKRNPAVYAGLVAAYARLRQDAESLLAI